MVDTLQNTKTVNDMFTLWKKWEDKVKETTVICNTLKQNFVDMLVNIKRFDDISAYTRTYLENKTKSNKALLRNRLDSDFGKQKWDFDSLIYCGLDTYGYQIDFSLKKEKYVLFIPVYRNLTTDNIAYAHHGRYCVYHKESRYTQKMVIAESEKPLVVLEVLRLK